MIFTVSQDYRGFTCTIWYQWLWFLLSYIGYLNICLLRNILNMLNSLICRHVQNKVYFILLIFLKNYYIITSDICLSLKNFTERLFVHKREQARIVIILHKTGKLPPVQRNHPLCIPLKILSNITLFVHVFSSILILRFLSFLLNDYYIINLAKQMTNTVYRNQIHYI